VNQLKPKRVELKKFSFLNEIRATKDRSSVRTRAPVSKVTKGRIGVQKNQIFNIRSDPVQRPEGYSFKNSDFKSDHPFRKSKRVGVQKSDFF